MNYTKTYTEDSLFGYHGTEDVFIGDSKAEFEKAVREAVNEEYPGWQVDFVEGIGPDTINGDPDHFELPRLMDIVHSTWETFDWLQVDYSAHPRTV